jgi:hypothetical protein
VQAASSIAITAAVTRAEPRRVGRMTPVCHRPSHVQVRSDHARDPEGSEFCVAAPMRTEEPAEGADTRRADLGREPLPQATPRLINGKDPDSFPAGAPIREDRTR